MPDRCRPVYTPSITVYKEAPQFSQLLFTFVLVVREPVLHPWRQGLCCIIQGFCLFIRFWSPWFLAWVLRTFAKHAFIQWTVNTSEMGGTLRELQMNSWNAKVPLRDISFCWGYSLVVECSLSMSKALGLVPSTAKSKQASKQKEKGFI